MTICAVRILEYIELSPKTKKAMLTGQEHEAWCSEELEGTLSERLHNTCDSCKYLFQVIAADLEKLQRMLMLEHGNVSLQQLGQKRGLGPDSWLLKLISFQIEWPLSDADKGILYYRRIAHSFRNKGPDVLEHLKKQIVQLILFLDSHDRGIIPDR